MVGAYIEDQAFLLCESLSSVKLSYGITTIGTTKEVFSYNCVGAFVGCNSLTKIMIPESVTSIGDTAFASCKNLSSITIPRSVTEIGPRAFEACNAVVIKGNIGSYAEQFAKQHDIPFLSLEEYPDRFITDIAINITEPTEHQNPSYDSITIDSKNLAVNKDVPIADLSGGIMWMDSETDSKMLSSDSFEGGKQYELFSVSSLRPNCQRHSN